MTRRYVLPWDVWLTKAQLEEIADGTHSRDATTAEKILDAMPQCYDSATYDGEVIRYRGDPALPILEYSYTTKEEPYV